MPTAHSSGQRQTCEGAALLAIMAFCAALHGRRTVLQGMCVQGRWLYVDRLVACCNMYCPFATPHGHSTDWHDIDTGSVSPCRS